MRNLTFVDTLLFMNAMLSTNYRLELTDICCRMITTDGIEVTLDDQGQAWDTKNVPKHRVV